MSVLTVVLASLAAFEHFYIFYLESLATHSASTSRVFNMDQEELHSADRRCGVRQLCPSLPFGRNTDGSVRQ